MCPQNANRPSFFDTFQRSAKMTTNWSRRCIERTINWIFVLPRAIVSRQKCCKRISTDSLIAAFDRVCTKSPHFSKKRIVISIVVTNGNAFLCLSSSARNRRSGIRSDLGQREIHSETVEYGRHASGQSSKSAKIDPKSTRTTRRSYRTWSNADLGPTTNVSFHGETVRSRSWTRQTRKIRSQCITKIISHRYVGCWFFFCLTTNLSGQDLIDESARASPKLRYVLPISREIRRSFCSSHCDVSYQNPSVMKETILRWCQEVTQFYKVNLDFRHTSIVCSIGQIFRVFTYGTFPRRGAMV